MEGEGVLSAQNQAHGRATLGVSKHWKFLSPEVPNLGSFSPKSSRPWKFFHPEFPTFGSLALLLAFFFSVLPAHAATRYVDRTNLTPSPPYLTWGTAARQIQHAVDVSSAGDLIRVTDGTYQTGSTEVNGMRNRVAVTNAITIRSENGPSATTIEGLGPKGPSAIRCVYMVTGAVLDGFTLKDGHTELGGDTVDEQSGAGAWCEPGAVITNCMILDCSANSDGGGVYGGMVYDSVVVKNDAGNYGGGTCASTVYDSLILTNTASERYGGSYSSVLHRATIRGNTAGRAGGIGYSYAYDSVIESNSASLYSAGGSYRDTLSNCVVRGNSAVTGGGGADESYLWSCTVLDNACLTLNGGGLWGCDAYNTFIAGNRGVAGGGASESLLWNCTVVDNTAHNAGGVLLSEVYNSIVYYNHTAISSEENSENTFEYSCIPVDPGGTGNFTNQPAILSLRNPHLAAGSPCADGGNSDPWMNGTPDIDGEDRVSNGIPDVGCDEHHAGSITGTLTAAIHVVTTNVTAGTPLDFWTDIDGVAQGFTWAWGDSTAMTNEPFALHTWSTTGTYDVVLSAWNLDGLAGETVTVHVVSGYTNYVSTNGLTIPPYETWENAATNIQQAIDANTCAGGVVLVSNGTYDVGETLVVGDLPNRVVITNRLSVRSLNGHAVTAIQGKGPSGPLAVRCAYVGNRGELSGFTLTGGHTLLTLELYNEMSAGGAFCMPEGLLTNCLITGNSSIYGAGGIYSGTIRNSTIENNNTLGIGGGMYAGTVYDSAIISNTTPDIGGGTYITTLYRSDVFYNSAVRFAGGMYLGSATDCSISLNASEGGGAGAYNSIISSCTVSGNVAETDGGGLYDCTTTGSEVRNNTAASEGGGVYGGTAADSLLRENRADYGGGISFGEADRCIISYNFASSWGGGAEDSTLTNCLLYLNEAAFGGGAEDSYLENCSVIGNLANKGGGVSDCIALNSIIYFNRARFEGDDLDWSDCDYCCVPFDPGGEGNITNAPMITSMNHPGLLTNSPCINAGTNQAWMTTGVDIDGLPRIAGMTVDIGPSEFSAISQTGALSVATAVTFTNTVVDEEVTLEALIEGSAHTIAWDFGDSSTTGNVPRVSHAYTSPGDYPVVLTAWNLNGNSAATVTIHVVNGFTNYVSPVGGNTPPYTSWGSAAHVIQDAVDANHYIGGVTMVADGSYTSGGFAVFSSLTNRVVLTNNITLRSQNGWTNCTILGDGYPGATNVVLRGVYLGSRARVEGFTIHNGSTRDSGNFQTDQSGGGICSETGGIVSNCYIFGNLAENAGAGTYNTIAYNSIYEVNIVTDDGGAVYGGRIYNCHVTNNTAGDSGGGIAYAEVYDSSIGGNAAGDAGGGIYYCSPASNVDLIVNSGSSGAGGYASTIYDALISGNTAGDSGGGVQRSTVYRSELTGNTASNSGGGLFSSTGMSCIVSGNTSGRDGGGANESFLRNCAVFNNAGVDGGGAANSDTESCTIIGNRASGFGGGVSGGAHLNSIIYHNIAAAGADNWDDASFTNSCTTPRPSGPGNFADAPGVASKTNPVVVANASVVDRGINAGWMSGEIDVLGNSRIYNGTVDVGSYEYTPSRATGTLSAAISPEAVYVIAGRSLSFEGGIGGTPSSMTWDWDDGSTLSSASSTEHAFTNGGTYDVVLSAGNNDNSAAITVTVHVADSFTTHVAPGGGHTHPFTNWVMAATQLQDAISAQLYVGGQVLVSNGVYHTGGQTVYLDLTNRVVITNAITVHAVNGPANTSIHGAGTIGPFGVRCVWLGDNATLSGFTVTNGRTRLNPADPEQGAMGGGVWSVSGKSVLTNCIVAGCSAAQGAGGVYRGTLIDCEVNGNASSKDGGGAFYVNAYDTSFYDNEAIENGGAAALSYFSNCTFTANRAFIRGGAVHEGELDECLIVSNRATLLGGGVYVGEIRRCRIIGNNAGQQGGGVGSLLSVVENSVIAENIAGLNGGGASLATIYNSTIVDNVASNTGGGTYECGLRNSIVYHNTASNSPNVHADLYASTTYTCTTPTPPGAGNIADAPLLTDRPAGDYSLSAASPCIDAGDNVSGLETDIEGVARPLDGDDNNIATVDMGSFEFVHAMADTDNDGLSDTNEISKFKTDPTDPDTDDDLSSDGQEYIADTDALDGDHYFRILSADVTNAYAVTFVCSTARVYTVQNSDDIATWTAVEGLSNITGGAGGTMTLLDTNETVGGLYRVSVSLP